MSDHGALVVAALLPHVVVGEERNVLAGRLGRVDECGGRVGDGVVAAATDGFIDDGLLAHLLDEPGRQLAARHCMRKKTVSDRTTGSARTDLLPESGRRERNAPSSSAPRRTLLTLSDMSDSSAADRPAALGLTMTSHRMPSRRHALTSCSGVSVRKSSSYICGERIRVRQGRGRRGIRGGERRTHEVRLEAGLPQVLDDVEAQVDQARRKAANVDVAPPDSPRAVRPQVLLLAGHGVLARGRVGVGGGDRKLGDGEREADDVRAPTREPDLGRGEARHDVVEPAGRARE